MDAPAPPDSCRLQATFGDEHIDFGPEKQSSCMGLWAKKGLMSRPKTRLSIEPWATWMACYSG